MKCRILFVDDDPNVLQGHRRALRSMRAEWEVDFAGSAQEALELMAQKPFDVLVTDLRMPGMDGPELLAEVLGRFPDVARVILSGSVDRLIALQSAGPTHQFLSKPCGPEELTATINRICSFRRLLRDDRLKQLAMQMKSIPSLPSLYLNIMTELKSEEPSIRNVGRIISQDPGMTAKILQLVNSAFFGLRRRVSDPTHAVNLLGLETLKSLVLSIHIFSSYQHVDLPLLSLDSLWRHSVRVGALARGIAGAEGCKGDVPNDSHGAGLLHDIGKLILAANFPKDYQEAQGMSDGGATTLPQAEEQVLGSTHSQIGAYILGLWGLPDALVEAVGFHHEPRSGAAGGFTPLTAVHAANALDHEQQPAKAGVQTSAVELDYLAVLDLERQLPGWRTIAEQMAEGARTEE